MIQLGMDKLMQGRKFPSTAGILRFLLLTWFACLVLGFQIACTPESYSPISTDSLNTQTVEPLPARTPQDDQSTAPGNLSPDQITTLASLQKIDDYPLYTMVYKGTYQQTNTLSQIDELNIENNIASEGRSVWACSLFAALGDEENYILGRNFDWEYSPGLLLFTDPPDGYSSVSMVDIAYLGFKPQELGILSELDLSELTPLLEAPNWPFDGMNEHGLAIGMAAVPPGQMLANPQKPTIGSLQVMRLILDQAADINQAITILENHNIDFGGGPALHYLIADSSGEAVLVEYFNGEMHRIPNDNPWHQATNFLISSFEDPQGQCTRYDKISNTMLDTSGNLSTHNAVDLLSSVSQNNTQWSLIYHLLSGEIDVIMGREFDQHHKFQLNP